MLKQKILEYIQTQTGDFNVLALELFAYQYEYCKPYQRYCQQLNKMPDIIQHWHEIPAVSTEVFREFDLTTLPLEKARYIFQTSGTTQEIKGRHYYHDMTLYDAVIGASFMKGLGLTNHDKPIFRILTPSFNEISTSSLFYMFEQAMDCYGAEGSEFYFKNNTLDCEKLAQDLIQDTHQNNPVVLLGTAFSFVNFCDYLKAHNLTFRLPKNSRLLETGGLKGRAREISKSDLYDLLQSTFGLTREYCFSEYGMTELSSQCYSKSKSNILTSPPWMPVRIINPQTGQDVEISETGLVQFFDLANETAVSAIITSDLAIRHHEGFELIGRAPRAVLRGCSTAFE